MRIVLIHGAATDSRVWRGTALVVHQATGATVEVPDRPQSGDLDEELTFLTPLCAGAFVIGVSGGATLGLELAARGVPLAGALLHEPAAGSLAPGLLTHVAEGLAAEGVVGFGHALYGPAWSPSDTRASVETIRREFAMFGAFEPTRPAPAVASGITLTVGGNSPLSRYNAVQSLAALLGVPWRILDGVGHAAHLEGGYLNPRSTIPELFTA